MLLMLLLGSTVYSVYNALLFVSSTTIILHILKYIFPFLESGLV